jgi:hypothetical protein
MEFLVGFEVNVPDGTPESEVSEREKAEASPAALRLDAGDRDPARAPSERPGGEGANP